MEHILIVYAITLCAIVLFARGDLISTDLTALLVLLMLVMTGVLSIEEGLSGFSHPGTISVAAMLVLSEAVNRTGALDALTRHLKALPFESEAAAAVVVLLAAGVVSMFVSNTATALIFIPLVLSLARTKQLAASRLLLPMAYAIILAGTCTLIASSTNIVVSEMGQRDYGLAPLGMFEITRLGLLAFGAGFLYCVVAARRLLPSHTPVKDIAERYAFREYVAELFVPENSTSVGKTFADAGLAERYNVNLLGIIRGMPDGSEQRVWGGAPYTALAAGDILLVHGGIDELLRFQRSTGLALKEKDILEDLTKGEGALAEGVISPTSALVGQTLKEMNFRARYGAFVLAVRTFGTTLLNKIGRVHLKVGDTLLIYGRRGELEALRKHPDFLFLETVTLPPVPEPRRALTSVLVLVGVILAAALHVLPLVVAQLAGIALLVFLRTMDLKEIYSAIPWRIILMIAGIIPLGIAYQKTGAAALLVSGLLPFAESLGPLAVLSVVYWIGSLLVEVIQKTPTAVLIMPLAMSAAQAADINPKAMLVTVLFAVSSCFASPMSYQVNALVYGAGHYRFADYLRAGLLLKLLLWLVVLAGVWMFWPLKVA
jgi:di/tricarboxylate transporter